MEPLNATAARALRTLLEAQPTTPAKVEFAWKIAAGPALARAGATEWTSDGTLAVLAKSDAWRKEIRYARPVIIERLRHLLGPDVVRRIVVRADAKS